MIESSLLFMYLLGELVSGNPADNLAGAGSLVDQTLIYTFDTDGVLQESATPAESSSPYWWLDSGGELVLTGGVGQTVSGPLPTVDRWRLRYKQTSSLDTADGYYPQNLFRLVTKNSWRDIDQSVRVYIDNLNLTPTPNRGEWSGIFLMNRYLDKDNLYYAGIRMDGYAVIKKKQNGIYYTLATEKIFGGEAKYDRDTIPNLIPGKKWLKLRSTVVTNADDSVKIELYVDEGKGEEKVLSVTDTGMSGAPAITQSGRAGLRSDYLDVWYDDYHATEV